MDQIEWNCKMDQIVKNIPICQNVDQIENGSNWKMDQMEKWVKLRNGSNWKMDQIEKWNKLKNGSNWKM